MAAFHWEARRRQMQLERRLRQEREGPGGSSGESLGVDRGRPPPGSSKKPDAEPPCPCHTAPAQPQGGKLLNRHSSVEYLQQW